MNEKDKHYFKANCKFGTKPLKYGAFHHGIQRAYMKFFEEFNQNEGNFYSMFESFKKEVLVENGISIQKMREAYNAQMNNLWNGGYSEVENLTFRQ